VTVVEFDFAMVSQACKPGGGSVLTSRTELAPAAGVLAGVAPARFVDGSSPVYAYETRYDGETPVTAVVLLSKGGSLNKIESALSLALHDADPLITQTPHIVLRYDGVEPLTEMDLPHRIFDGHVRAGSIDGKPATANPIYRAARDATPANARALLETSPITLVLAAGTRHASPTRVVTAAR
jgi:CRISPR-associated protein Csb1